MNVYFWNTLLLARQHRVYNKIAKLLEESIHMKFEETNISIVVIGRCDEGPPSYNLKE